MIGGDKHKPKEEKRIPLDPGVHPVRIDDVVTGVSDKNGNLYWINKLLTEDNVQFDHFIQCTETQYKSMDKVFKRAAEQMEALMLYDKIGEHKDYDSWFQKAIDMTYALKGKTIEYTVSEYNIDGKKGVWGSITGYLDLPNEAIQTVSKKAVDEKEEIPF